MGKYFSFLLIALNHPFEEIIGSVVLRHLLLRTLNLGVLREEMIET